MRDPSKARGVEHTEVFERRATPLAAMQRGPNAQVILRRALTIDIIQAAPRSGVEVLRSSVLVTYKGDIVDHKFRARTRQVRPAPKIANAPVLVSDGSSSDEIALLDDGLVYGHELKVDVRGEVGTSTVFFQGQTPLAVFCP